MPTVSLALVFGLPASGKTSLCRSLQEWGAGDNAQSDPRRRNIKYVHVCYDSIISPDEQRRLACNARKMLSFQTVAAESDLMDKATIHSNLEADITSQDSDRWKDARTTVFGNVDHFISDLITGTLGTDEILSLIKRYGFNSNITEDSTTVPDDQFILLIDDNFYYRSMRHAYHSLAAQRQVSFCQVYINCDLIKAQARNCLREIDALDSLVPRDVMQKMAENMEPPEPGKHKWEQFSLVLKARETGMVAPLVDIKKPTSASSADQVRRMSDSDFIGTSTEHIRSGNEMNAQICSSEIHSVLVPEVVNQIQKPTSHQELDLYVEDATIPSNGNYAFLTLNTKKSLPENGKECSIDFGFECVSSTTKAFSLPHFTRMALFSLFQRSLAAPVTDLQETLLKHTLAAASAAESRAVCSKSVVHQCDLILRQLVSASVESSRLLGPRDTAQHARVANQARQKLLQQLRNGSEGLPVCMTMTYDSEMDQTMRQVLFHKYTKEIRCLTGCEEDFIGLEIGRKFYHSFNP